MTPRPRISFGKIAYRVGAVTLVDLEEARRVRDEKGGTLEEILLQRGVLTGELAEFVRDAFRRACAVCEDCGRRTDISERDQDDFACRCGGTFVALEGTLAPGATLDPNLLQSETGDESDVGSPEE